jgi:hypothetical protein
MNDYIPETLRFEMSLLLTARPWRG